MRSMRAGDDVNVTLTPEGENALDDLVEAMAGTYDGSPESLDRLLRCLNTTDVDDLATDLSTVANDLLPSTRSPGAVCKPNRPATSPPQARPAGRSPPTAGDRRTERGPGQQLGGGRIQQHPRGQRRVEALLDSRRVPALERLGVTFGHGTSVYVIFDSLLRWTGRGMPSTTVDQITAALVAAFPGHAVYCTHDGIGFELVCGDVTLAGAVADGQAQKVS